MISARRAALLGLTVPLSAIMLAVLGLWPEPEDDDAASSLFPPPADAKGGGDGRPAAKPGPTAEKIRAEDEAYWAALKEMQRMSNMAAVLSAVAFAEMEYT